MERFPELVLGEVVMIDVNVKVDGNVDAVFAFGVVAAMFSGISVAGCMAFTVVP